MRPSWIEVDLDAIQSNVAAIVGQVSPAAVCAVVKADGYGHGDVPAAQAALAGGASWLAVALVEEGNRLREAGIGAPILLLSEAAAADAGRVVDLDITATVYSRDGLEAIAVASARSGTHPVHVKVDTGMHRVGADASEAAEIARLAAADSRVQLEGLWTHFAASEEDAEFTKRQWVELEALRTLLAAEGIEVPIAHAANTAGALEHPEARFDLVRVGLGIYGLRPAPHVGTSLDLRAAMRVVSQVAKLRQLAAGERPSYGRSRPMPTDGVVATIPVGYADGIARKLSSSGGQVLIRGRRYPFAGNVTMDQIVIDVGMDPVAVGDEVVLLGGQGDEEITADDWAERLDTINYEIVSGFGPRLPRRHSARP